jgi:dUTP pyrophosphatase
MRMADMEIAIQRLPHALGLELPDYASAAAAGMDLRAAVETEMQLAPGERKLVPTGFCIELPTGFEAQIRPRSGLALKHGITLPNSPGTIDADYRGEVGVIMANISAETFTIRRGDRIAQMVIARHERATWREADALTGTDRGAGGFGSTGKS